jgi:hypothetical protein
MGQYRLGLPKLYRAESGRGKIRQIGYCIDPWQERRQAVTGEQGIDRPSQGWMVATADESVLGAQDVVDIELCSGHAGMMLIGTGN